MQKNEAIARIREHIRVHRIGSAPHIKLRLALEMAINALQNSDDKVKVIRCKNCEWFNKPGCAIFVVDDCDNPGPEDYCSFAERKKEANETNEA